MKAGMCWLNLGFRMIDLKSDKIISLWQLQLIKRKSTSLVHHWLDQRHGIIVPLDDCRPQDSKGHPGI